MKTTQTKEPKGATMEIEESLPGPSSAGSSEEEKDKKKKLVNEPSEIIQLKVWNIIRDMADYLYKLIDIDPRGEHVSLNVDTHLVLSLHNIFDLTKKCFNEGSLDGHLEVVGTPSSRHYKHLFNESTHLMKVVHDKITQIEVKNKDLFEELKRVISQQKLVWARPGGQKKTFVRGAKISTEADEWVGYAKTRLSFLESFSWRWWSIPYGNHNKITRRATKEEQLKKTAIRKMTEKLTLFVDEKNSLLAMDLNVPPRCHTIRQYQGPATIAYYILKMIQSGPKPGDQRDYLSPYLVRFALDFPSLIPDPQAFVSSLKKMRVDDARVVLNKVMQVGMISGMRIRGYYTLPLSFIMTVKDADLLNFNQAGQPFFKVLWENAHRKILVAYPKGTTMRHEWMCQCLHYATFGSIGESFEELSFQTGINPELFGKRNDVFPMIKPMLEKPVNFGIVDYFAFVKNVAKAYSGNFEGMGGNPQLMTMPASSGMRTVYIGAYTGRVSASQGIDWSNLSSVIRQLDFKYQEKLDVLYDKSVNGPLVMKMGTTKFLDFKTFVFSEDLEEDRKTLGSAFEGIGVRFFYNASDLEIEEFKAKKPRYY